MSKSQFRKSLAISVSLVLVSCAPGPVGTQVTQPVVKQSVKQPSKKSPSGFQAAPTNRNLTPVSKGNNRSLTPDSKGNKLTPSPVAKSPEKPEPTKVAPTVPKPEEKALPIPELLKKEESELTNLNVPEELDEEQANALELGEQPDSTTKKQFKNEVAQKLKNNAFQKIKVTGQLALPSTGFKTQQTANLANYVVQVYGPDGALLAETTSDAEGQYSFENIPSGLRVEIVAFPPFAFSNRLTAIVDIPPATAPDQTIPSNVSSRSTALMKVVRSAKRRGKSNIDRVSVKELEEKFKAEIDAVDEQMKLSLNQEVMDQLRDDPNNTSLQTTLSQARSKQSKAIRKAAQVFRKTAFEDSSLQTLDENIITSPVVLRGSVTFDAVIVPPPTNLMVVRRSTTTIEIQWDFAKIGNHTYKVYLNGSLQAEDFTRHIFKFSDLNPDTEYTIELQTITERGESGKVSLKASTTDQGSTGTGNFGGGGDTGSDANPVATTNTTTTANPSISSLTPNSGQVGSTVTIIGTDFDATVGNNTVKFSSTTATVTAATSTSLTVTVPAGLASGATHVSVEVNGQTSATSAFTVSPPPQGTLVNTYTTSNQARGDIAMDSSGNFVITWKSSDQDGSDDGIFAQRYDNTGVTQGPEFQVNTYTTNDQREPAIAMDSDGDFVISWQSYQGVDENEIIAQRFNSAGVTQGSEFQVNTYTTSFQSYISIAMDSNGDFVITWDSYAQDGDETGVFAQRFNSGGVVQGSEFQVNTYTTRDQSRAQVAMDNSGNFVIAWDSRDQDGNLFGMYAKRYNSNGVAQ